MSIMQRRAAETIDRLHAEGRLGDCDYCTVHDGLYEIETLQERDEALRRPSSGNERR